MRLTQPIGPKDHILGPPDAPVTVAEYMEYECPSCAQAHDIVSQVLSNVGELVRYVPRHFPVPQLHPHALLAAQAAEAAGAQRMFWPMHSTLIENQDALDAKALLLYAEALGLSVPRFSDELRSGVHLRKVEEDLRSGVRSGVKRTPAFFINGLRLDRAWDAATLTSAIRAAARIDQRTMR